jgi:hypothetical protein
MNMEEHAAAGHGNNNAWRSLAALTGLPAAEIARLASRDELRTLWDADGELIFRAPGRLSGREAQAILVRKEARRLRAKLQLARRAADLRNGIDPQTGLRLSSVAAQESLARRRPI